MFRLVLTADAMRAYSAAERQRNMSELTHNEPKW